MIDMELLQFKGNLNCWKTTNFKDNITTSGNESFHKQAIGMFIKWWKTNIIVVNLDKINVLMERIIIKWINS
jgi:hypothetical protein